MELHSNHKFRLVILAILVMVPILLSAQCPTEAQLESGGTLNIPTHNDCSAPVTCSITTTDAWNINGNITVESCVTLDLNQNSNFIYILGGTFTINEGAIVNTNRRLIVEGATLIVNGTLNVGDGSGNDNFVIQQGGSVIVGESGKVDVGNGNVRIGGNGGANTGNLTLDGTLTTSGNVTIRNSGDLNGDGKLTFGGSFNSTGTTGDSFANCSNGSSNSFCGETTLPVKLLSFKTRLLEQETAHLAWETASELNNEGFYIEKSTDGVTFESIGFIEGNGTTDENQHYQYFDRSISASSYYRLRQVDFDGQFEFSPISFVEVASGERIEQIGIYPNPVGSHFNFTNTMAGVFDWVVVNTSGQKLFAQQNLTVPQAEAHLNGLLNALDPGIYMILYQNGNTRQHLRMLKR